MSASLVLFRNDLRLDDNPALRAAFEAGAPVHALFVHETDETLRAIGGAARWWLNKSLETLAADLQEIGVPLRVEQGPLQKTVMTAASRIGADAVFWNRRYGPAERGLDGDLKAALKANGIRAESFNAGLLVEPFDIATQSGGPFKVFTPFWKTLRQRDIPRPLPAPSERASDAAPDFALPDAYRAPGWATTLEPYWQPGAAGAAAALERFLDERIKGYAKGRDVPSAEATSVLSPHLRFGEIGPRQVWHAAMAHAAADPSVADAADKFLSELAWRDFSHNLLFHFPDITQQTMQARYADFPWRHDPAALSRWQKGQTGIPIVDAGMRQLWQTGYMHNRVRMLAASFLTKNLLVHWRDGEAWFWDTLVDADPANNPASWQWVAGCGADAAPYFRIFNPVTQGEKFDPEGTYVRTWVPELSGLPASLIHRPFEARAEELAQFGVALGETYPKPMADLKASRARALEMFSDWKDAGSA